MSLLFRFILRVAAAFLVLFVFVFATGDQKDPERDYKVAFHRNYRILTPELPEKASFAGEEAPLDLYYVAEGLEREILAATFMHSSTILMFKRAHRWFPVIDPILKRNNIPADFRFLALAESNLAHVVSPARAEGFWQFLKTTGQEYGLEITEEVDERYHVEKSTEAACRYFRKAFEQYGSWTLAAAAYNRGMDGITDALRSQKVSNYYDLYLNDETARYVFRILALKEVYNNPVKYGFYLRESDFYPAIPTRTVTVDSSVTDLPAFALRMKINYRILRELNPWLRRYTLSNKKGKSYLIALPLEGALSHEALNRNRTEALRYFHDTLQIKAIH